VSYGRDEGRVTYSPAPSNLVQTSGGLWISPQTDLEYRRIEGFINFCNLQRGNWNVTGKSGYRLPESRWHREAAPKDILVSAEDWKKAGLSKLQKGILWRSLGTA